MKRTILALTLMAALLAVGATIAAAADDTSKVQSVRVIDIWGAYVDSNNRMVHIEMPPHAADNSFTLKFTEKTPADFSTPPTNTILLPDAFSVEFLDGDEDLSTLKIPGSMVIKYNPSDLGGRSESTLKLMRWYGSVWGEVSANLNTAAHTITAQLSEPGTYAVSVSNIIPPAAPAPTAVPAPTQAPAPAPAPAAAPTPLPISAAPPSFKLGFATLASLIPGIAGQPLEDEHYGPNGDSLQQTTTGLMVWRKADNWTAFTNGSRTWINGPFGLQERANEERFDWEK